jgi:DNA repair exonuclease SbcCD nuclease subunit
LQEARALRFLHTADIHLAKPFGRFDEETRVALRAARLDALGRIGEAARAHLAEFVLIAGDTFDAEAPPGKVIRRALDVIARFDDVIWVLMPGNHDSLAAAGLWERLIADCPANLRLALTPEVIDVGDAAILPAPPTVRHPGSDLTAWMTTAETGARFRIGLAHGRIRDFGTQDKTPDVIPPDRAELAGLDYLALGDWHGQMQITPRTWYAGTPEPDSFKDHAPAGVLLVEIASPGDVPRVTPLPLGQYRWQALSLDMLAGSDPVAQLQRALPQSDRDRALVSVEATGRLGLQELSALRDACAQMADAFHAFHAQLDGLGIEQNPDDLDMIAEGGALRAAADSLFAATSLEGRSAENAEIARIALTHLFHVALEEQTP